MKTIYFIVALLLITTFIKAQNILDDYITQGIESNLAIKQNQMALESAQHSLKVAKGMFLPSVSTQSRYSLARGGRTIDFPVGDMMNPVYSTLNDILVAQGGSPQFPMLENEQINFMREEELEARVSLTQPIYYPSLLINKRIEEKKFAMSELELEQYKYELIFQIKEAYYNYLKALQYFELVEKTKDVVNENHRVSMKLMENDMITLDAVLRAKSEISKIELFETEATKNIEMARSYFNFLLNRELNELINTGLTNGIVTNPELESLTENGLANRQELQLLDHQISIMDDVERLHKSEVLPNLVLAVDYGIQSEGFSIDNDSDFVIGSLVLRWNLFNGFTNKNKQIQTRIEKQRVEFMKEEVSKKIELEIKQDLYDVNQQIKNLHLAKTRSSEASEVYRIIEKRFRLGETPLIELLDARNNMTESEAQVILTKYDYLVSIARLENSSHSELGL